MKTYLVIRFSAMGDILLTLPVLAAACEQNPNARFIVLTRPKFSVFFEGYPQIQVLSIDVDKEYDGIKGLWKLSRQLRREQKFGSILDLHQNIRSFFIKLFLLRSSSYTIFKGRRRKKALTRKNRKSNKILLHSTERYARVLRKAGLKVDLNEVGQRNYFKELEPLDLHKESHWIGIAPFAQHEGKIWPKEYIREVMLSIPESSTILLFGGGDEEIYLLRQLSVDCDNVEVIGPKYSLKQQLSLISALDVMLCMDSGNMHLAALAGIRTVSVWGATHPNAGFGPFGSQEHNIVQIPKSELPCRPCSIYGNKPCYREDYACIHLIDVDEVSELVNKSDT